MSRPHYVIKKVGEQYVEVLQDPYPRATRAAYVGWGALLVVLGSHRRGWIRMALYLGGIGLAVRGVCGCDWLRAMRASWRRYQEQNTRRGQGPSYQNEFVGRATQMPADLVDEQAMESFPASDPPARTATTSVAP